MYVVAFGFDHTHRYSQSGRRGSGLKGLPPPCGQLTRCFSAVAELLVTIIKFPTSPLHIVRSTLLTMYNGEVGNFIMVKL